MAIVNRGQVPRLLRTVFAEQDLFRCGLVVEKNQRGEEILSETAGLNPNYIRQLLAGAPRTQSTTDPKTLLYLMLRHATLLEHARAGLHVLQERGLVSKLETYERELVNVTSETRTIFNLMDQRVAGLTGTATLAEYLERPRFSPSTPAERIVDEYRNALLTLEPQPTAELERLFTETLDVCAYRLDAWTTSLATKRLRAMRKVHPLGAYVGAYGWVEDLKPLSADERYDVPIEGEPGVSASSYSGGYIYAPSMTHGAAAAVLRNAYMTRAGDQQSPYAINLSSARVRAALWLLDTVREGQPLTASLGYLFERGLHDDGLDRFIDDFRNKYRLVPSLADDGGEPAEAIAARNVVDGYALVLDFKKPGAIYWPTMIQPPSAGERGRVDTVLASVDNALDALADLLTAESVFQMVGGSAAGAGATLDAMGKGAHPPEPEIASRARGGASVTHRVALVLDGAAAAGSPWAELASTPRSDTEPRLNAWIGHQLGNPSDVVCVVSFSDGEPRRVTLRDLQLQPLDVLTLARGEGSLAALDSELDRRVAYAAMRLAGPGATRPVIQYEVAAAELALTERTFPEMLEVARSINALLSGARALQPRDLLVPEESSDVEAEGADLRAAQLQARADAVLAHLAAAIAGLDAALPAALPPGAAIDLGALRAALRAASLLGVAAAFPPLSDTGLTTIAQSVVLELRGRWERANAQTDPIGRVREILGRDFVLLPSFTPPHRGELTQALAQAPELGPDPDATLSVWFAKAARVRQPLGAWRLLSLYASAMGRTPAAPQVIQLPYTTGARWVGLPVGPQPFAVGDFKDLPSLATQLRLQSNPVSAFLNSQFSNSTLQVLNAYQGPSSNPAPLQAALVQELNTIIENQALYDAQRFAGIRLRLESQRLQARNPQGDDLARLNRLLLEDAYPLELSKIPRPWAGQVSLMLLGGAVPDANGAWAGVLLDEWVELIPNAAEDAAVVFHYDRPSAEAPQAVLVAMTPDAAQPWSLDLLLRTVEQTFAMAKTRGFDGEWKHATADRETDHALYNNPWLPLIFLADGDSDATIASSLRQCLQRGTTA